MRLYFGPQPFVPLIVILERIRLVIFFIGFRKEKFAKRLRQRVERIVMGTSHEILYQPKILDNPIQVIFGE